MKNDLPMKKEGGPCIAQYCIKLPESLRARIQALADAGVETATLFRPALEKEVEKAEIALKVAS